MCAVGLDGVPPVTLAVLALNIYLYLFPAASLSQAGVSVQHVYWFKEWRRLLLSPVHHADGFHLLFNLGSFLWKGIILERLLGGAWFFSLLVVFSLLTGLVYLLLQTALADLTRNRSHLTTSVVGFSGVLFALKVLINHYYPGGETDVMGVPVPNCYAVWMELLVIHITIPASSFVGHLSGILVGLLYIAIMKKYTGLN